MKAFLLIILGLVHAASGQTFECPGLYTAISTGCYLFPDTQVTWYDASIFCQFAAGHLVNIDSSVEQSALKTYHVAHFNNTVSWRWIGATDSLSDGLWRWVPSGAPVVYTNWNSGQPVTDGTNNCAVWNITVAVDYWTTHQCDGDLHFPICETLPL